MSDILASVGVLAALGGVTGITKLFEKRLGPEGSRKVIHITMGCSALSFPFIFEHRLSVALLGVVALAVMLILRLNSALRKGLGSALFGVSRKSFGELYFIASIVIVFVLHTDAFEYIIPISVLTFADSVAALIGTNYGRYNLATAGEDAKSGEGSVMFFIVAFICALVPLQLMTETGRAEVLVISFMIGVLAAMIETVAINGSDNLLLPLLTYSFLRYTITRPLPALFTNLAFMLFEVVGIIIVYKATNLTKLSMAYSLLVGYVFMIQGGPIWVLPGLTLILTFGILPLMKEEEKHMIQNFKVVECNSIVGMFCLWIAVFFPAYREILYIAFSFSFNSHLCINTYSRFYKFEGTSVREAALWAFIKSTVFIALPALVVAKMRLSVFALYLLFTALSLRGSVYLNKQPRYIEDKDEGIRWNKLLVGSLTFILAALLIFVEGFYDLSGQGLYRPL